MSSTIEHILSRATPLESSDWVEAGFLEMDPETRGVHVEERLTDGIFVLRAEIPGMDPAKDFYITVENGFLTLRAGFSEGATKQNSKARFGHVTPLPTGARSDHATAKYENGVLTVRVPVSE
ncbi:HSP20 family protein [Streptomyces sp. SAI-170]|uniref:Hsp20/alpha crystallin family protein n=1 Tax=Streptomyces sp. SAI-170 TaxID=3377729 RepID=UPI003C799756